jgi:hypothetical protein
MRRWLRPWAAAVVLACVGAAGCEEVGDPSPINPDPLPNVTDTFSGTLNRNGAATFNFTVAGSGLVALTLTKVLPDNTVGVGLSMGTWNGTTCSIVLANDNAVENTTVVGQAGGIGALCVRVYDVGKIGDPIEFEVTVRHP